VITPSDRSYRSAKAVRQGRARIDPALDEFVARFREAYGVPPLWLGLDLFHGQPGQAPTPRLEVVLERTAEADRFGIGPYTLDPRKQREVARMLAGSVGAGMLPGLFGLPIGAWNLPYADVTHVVFADFEGAAKSEAHARVTEDELETFEAALGLGETLWCLRRFWGPPIVFVHTQSQAAALADSPARQHWAETYFAMVRRHDEFGYLKLEDIAIPVDSKENFEENYDGSWAYYIR
jgi:hypothetical protein